MDMMHFWEHGPSVACLHPWWWCFKWQCTMVLYL